MDNVLLDTYEMEDGIPQGSTLSVTLFAIAVNDLMATIEPTIQKCLYVDDLLLSYSAPFVHDIQKAINEINMFALSRGF